MIIPGKNVKVTGHRPAISPPPAVPPTVGRDVHYVSYGTPNGEFLPACRAAKVTEVGAWLNVPDGTFRDGEPGGDTTRPPVAGERRTVIQEWHPDACHLTVMNPTGLFFNVVPHDETVDSHGCRRPGTWHWPERV